MFILEEYLAAIALAILVALVGSVLVLTVLTLTREGDVFERSLLSGSVVLPPSWRRLWLAMKVADKWRALSVTRGHRSCPWWRRLRAWASLKTVASLAGRSGSVTERSVRRKSYRLRIRSLDHLRARIWGRNLD